MMDARYSDGSKPTSHEVSGLLLAALFAGRDTSSASTAWALVELARNPSHQAILRSEIHAAGPGETVDEAFLRLIPSAERVMKEVLRLHPPLFMLLRRVLQDLPVDGLTIGAGSLVAVSPKVAHRDPRVVARPDDFDPDRFSPGRDEDKQPFAWIPFGGGRHRCVGTAFAMLQIKTIIALILRDYELALGEDLVDDDYGILVVGPKSPLRLHYRRREQARAAG